MVLSIHYLILFLPYPLKNEGDINMAQNMKNKLELKVKETAQK
jgi:hypothetical protein